MKSVLGNLSRLLLTGVLIVFVLAGCNIFIDEVNEGAPPESIVTIGAPSQPIQVTLIFFDVAQKGQSTIQMAVDYNWGYASQSSTRESSEVQLTVKLSEGLEQTSGVLTQTGVLAEKAVERLETSIIIPKEGIYKVEARARVIGYNEGGYTEAWIHVVGDSITISETEPVSDGPIKVVPTLPQENNESSNMTVPKDWVPQPKDTPIEPRTPLPSTRSGGRK